MKRWYNYSKVKAEDKCRFCEHPGLLHMEVKDFGEEKMTARWHECHKQCGCPGFAPADNLQFLEMAESEGD